MGILDKVTRGTGRSGSGGRRRGVSPFKAGLMIILLTTLAVFLAFSRVNPFTETYELSATFHTVDTLRPASEVRIAGVAVGTVTAIESVGGSEDAARVTMEIEDSGLPIHEDAELKIRPRIFLEGNEFVELSPGTPSAPVLESGATIPVNQTATPVSLFDVLDVLDTDTREDLRTFLAEYSLFALKGDGARGFRRSIELWEDAYRDTAIANQALGGTEPGDLFRVLRGQQGTFDALSRDPEALGDLVTSFNTTAAAFARQDDALQATIPALRDVLEIGPPALASLNSSLPGVRRFAVDALPTAVSSQTTVPAAFPFIEQARLLVQPAELRGLSDDLRQTIPPLARLNQRAVPLLDQNRALSACTNDVLLPFARTPVPTGAPGPDPAVGPESAGDEIVGELDFQYDTDSTNQPVFELLPRSLVGLSGESRVSDANGKFFRANFKLDNVATIFDSANPALGPALATFGTGEERSRPAPPPQIDEQAYRRPVFRPDFPCELSVPPDLRAPEATETLADDAILQIPDLSGLLPDDLPDLGLPISAGGDLEGFGDDATEVLEGVTSDDVVADSDPDAEDRAEAQADEDAEAQTEDGDPGSGEQPGGDAAP